MLRWCGGAAPTPRSAGCRSGSGAIADEAHERDGRSTRGRSRGGTPEPRRPRRTRSRRPRPTGHDRHLEAAARAGVRRSPGWACPARPTGCSRRTRGRGRRGRTRSSSLSGANGGVSVPTIETPGTCAAQTVGHAVGHAVLAAPQVVVRDTEAEGGDGADQAGSADRAGLSPGERPSQRDRRAVGEVEVGWRAARRAAGRRGRPGRACRRCTGGPGSWSRDAAARTMCAAAAVVSRSAIGIRHTG